MTTLSLSITQWRQALARLLFTLCQPRPRDAPDPGNLPDHLKRDIGIRNGSITTRAWF